MLSDWSRMFWSSSGENCSGPGLDQQYYLLLEETVLLSDWSRLFWYLIGAGCSGFLLELEQTDLLSDLSRLLCSLI